jgi:hypothetical protein
MEGMSVQTGKKNPQVKKLKKANIFLPANQLSHYFSKHLQISMRLKAPTHSTWRNTKV